MKKLLSFILAILMLATCLVACNETPETPVDPDGGASDTEPNSQESESLLYPPVDPANATLFVGYGREDITPSDELLPSLRLAGYAEGREITEVESSLFVSVKAPLFTSGEKTGAGFFSEIFGTVISGLFCASLTARSYSSRAKRLERPFKVLRTA